MLKHLHIQNYALIETLDLDLDKGLVVITGETGAGKSILLGAISLLLGQRADSKTLFDPNKKCIIEGVFDIENYPSLQEIFVDEDIDLEENCIIRREINPQGKSRSFINDSPVNLDALKKIGQELVDIHSQQDNSWMYHPDFSLDLVDSFAQNQEIKQAYSVDYKAYVQALTDYKNLKSKAETGQQNLAFLQFQRDELDKAQLKKDEYESLKSQVERLQNTEQIREKLANLSNLLSISDYSALQQTRLALQQSQALSKWGTDFENWKNRLESIWIELKDLSLEIESEAESSLSEPIDLENLQKRLDLLNRLLQKYQASSLEELIETHEKIDNELILVENVEENLLKAEKNVLIILEMVKEKGKKLQASRLNVLDSIIKQLLNSLQQLGIPNATLDWEIQEKELGHSGLDKIQLLFSANKGLAPKAFKLIASGGEMSRLMLSIKHLLAEKRSLPTLILDEIDTGVSGEIAIKIGQMLGQMSRNHQLIAITHLPQIASAGQKHLFVYKNHSGEKTVSAIKHLSEEERIDEIAKMIGGQNGYLDLRENVKKLIADNRVN
ncbi:DNA repair protein RecN [Aquirufa sp. ROCK2-A2]